MRLNLLSILATLVLVACGDKADDDTTATDADADADTDADADADADADDTGETEPGGFTVNGTGTHAVSREPVAAGLCVVVADPTPALLGGNLTPLAEAVTGEGGTFTLANVVTDSTLGLTVVISDCPDATEATVYPSATGLSSSLYSELGDGGVIDDFAAWSFTLASASAVDVGLATAGHVDSEGNPANFTENGGLMGWIFDADNTAAAGARITCAAGHCPDYYATSFPVTDPNFLMDGDTPANATSDLGNFLLPGAPITTYTITHPSLSFDSSTLGSLPGMVLFVSIFSDDALPTGGGDTGSGSGDDTGTTIHLVDTGSGGDGDTGGELGSDGVDATDEATPDGDG